MHENPMKVEKNDIFLKNIYVCVIIDKCYKELLSFI